MAAPAPESLRGKTVRWTFDEGPTKGTAVLNFEDGTVLSFASNEKSWFPAKGSFEVVE